MKSIKIIDKNNKEYIVKVDENSLEKKVSERSMTFGVKFEVYDQKKEILGHGQFKIEFKPEDAHISDDKILNKLMHNSSQQIKRSIEMGKDIESVSYNMRYL